MLLKILNADLVLEMFDYVYSLQGLYKSCPSWIIKLRKKMQNQKINFIATIFIPFLEIVQTSVVI